MKKKWKIAIPVLAVIIGATAGLVYFELQYGATIPDRLPAQAVNTLADFQKGILNYTNPLASQNHVADWAMEGPGEVTFVDEGMEMASPGEADHHVFWCPDVFPESFWAEWTVQNVDTDAGLLIVFFSARGLHGENVLDDSLPRRTGTFTQYTRGAIRNYHISYYANAPNEPGRERANLRKNPGFDMVQAGRAGISHDSTTPHVVTLIKDRHHVVCFIDGREIINWEDSPDAYWGEGQIGFRQMKWSRTRYCNFSVWSLGE